MHPRRIALPTTPFCESLPEPRFCPLVELSRPPAPSPPPASFICARAMEQNRNIATNNVTARSVVGDVCLIMLLTVGCLGCFAMDRGHPGFLSPGHDS